MNTNQTNLTNLETTQEIILNNQHKILAAQAMILTSLEKLDLVLANQDRLEELLAKQGKGSSSNGENFRTEAGNNSFNA